MFRKRIGPRAYRALNFTLQNAYHAVTLKNVEQIPAVVTKTNDKICLETYEPHYKQIMQFKKWDRNFSDTFKAYFFTENTWKMKFYLNGYGEIKDNEYAVHSSEFLSYRKENYYSKNKMPYYYFSPDITYKIPQKIWDEFISHLAYQDIAKQINLSTHRHLWPGYNYAIDHHDPAVRKFRAQALGSYHFIHSLILNTNHSFEEVIINNDDILKSIKQGIDRGESPVNLISSNIKYLTPSLINKFRHCPSWQDIFGIGTQLILPEVSEKKEGDSNQLINVNKLHTVVSTLPSSVKLPHRFEQLINDTRSIMNTSSQVYVARPHFFHQVKNKYGFFKELKYDWNLFSSYSSALTRDLFFPEMIKSILHKFQNYEECDIAEALKYSSCVWNMLRHLENLVLEKISETTFVEKCIELERRWKEKTHVINLKKPIGKFQEIWHPLFLNKEETINGVVFTCLTSTNMLKLQCKELNSYEHEYAKKCMNGYLHVLKVKTESGKQSTLRLTLSFGEKEKKIVNLKDNFSYRNKKPSSEIICATDKLLEMIKNDKIALNDEIGRVKGSYSPIHEATYNIYSHDFNDESMREQIYQAYKDTKVLPSVFKEKNYKTMIEESGFSRIIQKVIDNGAIDYNLRKYFVPKQTSSLTNKK